jgi:hypothetical protein
VGELAPIFFDIFIVMLAGRREYDQFPKFFYTYKNKYKKHNGVWLFIDLFSFYAARIGI